MSIERGQDDDLQSVTSDTHNLLGQLQKEIHEEEHQKRKGMNEDLSEPLLLSEDKIEEDI